MTEHVAYSPLEIGWCAGQPVGRGDRALLVDQPVTVVAVEAVGADQRRAAEAQTDVSGVPARDRLGRDLQEEVGLP